MGRQFPGWRVGRDQPTQPSSLSKLKNPRSEFREVKDWLQFVVCSPERRQLHQERALDTGRRVLSSLWLYWAEHSWEEIPMAKERSTRKDKAEQSWSPCRTGNNLCPHQPSGKVSQNTGHWVESSEGYQCSSEAKLAIDKDLHQQTSKANLKRIQLSPSFLTVNQYLKEYNKILQSTSKIHSIWHPIKRLRDMQGVEYDL